MPFSFWPRFLNADETLLMHKSFRIAFWALAAAVLPVACATHPKDFIPNGAGVNLAPTDPAHIQVLDSIPRGMVIGTILVDRAKAKNTQEIIQMAKVKAASVGGDFIVWEDSLGTLPVATPTPGEAPPNADYGEVGHSMAESEVPPAEDSQEKTPKARFTVGIFLGN
jgi:hypothetical protein